MLAPISLLVALRLAESFTWARDVVVPGAGAAARSSAHHIMILKLGRSCRLKRIITMRNAVGASPDSNRKSTVLADVADTA